ncbi:unnamed protein product [Cunninghamella blakesleeana]
MISVVYTGMEMNFAQSFTAPQGLSKSRMVSFDEETYQPHQQTAYLLNDLNVSSVVPLVEPMIHNNHHYSPMSVPSSSPSLSTSSITFSNNNNSNNHHHNNQNNMYYPQQQHSSSSHHHTYPTYISESTNTSVTSSPSMDDSWKYTSTELLSEPTMLSSSTTSTTPQPSSYSLPTSSFIYSQQQQQQDDYYSSCSTSPSMTHSPSLNIYDPLPSFQLSNTQSTSPSFISYQQSPSPPPSTMTIIPTSHSTSSLSSLSSNHTQSQKRKRAQSSSSSSMIYSKHHQHRTSLSSPSSHPYPQKSTSSEVGHRHHTGGSFSSFISRKMTSSFPTKHDTSSGTSKRYECHICSKKFTRPSSLTTHIYSHTGEKPFKCPVEGCGRHFSVVSNLRRHAKIHSNPSSKS